MTAQGQKRLLQKGAIDLLILAVVVIISLAIPFTAKLVQQNQEVRKQAAEEAGGGDRCATCEVYVSRTCFNSNEVCDTCYRTCYDTCYETCNECVYYDDLANCTDWKEVQCNPFDCNPHNCDSYQCNCRTEETPYECGSCEHDSVTPECNPCGSGDCNTAGLNCEQDGGKCEGTKPNCSCNYPPEPTATEIPTQTPTEIPIQGCTNPSGSISQKRCEGRDLYECSQAGSSYVWEYSTNCPFGCFNGSCLFCFSDEWADYQAGTCQCTGSVGEKEVQQKNRCGESKFIKVDCSSECVVPTSIPTVIPEPTLIPLPPLNHECATAEDCEGEGRCNIYCSGWPRTCKWSACPIPTATPTPQLPLRLPNTGDAPPSGTTPPPAPAAPSVPSTAEKDPCILHIGNDTNYKNCQRAILIGGSEGDKNQYVERNAQGQVVSIRWDIFTSADVAAQNAKNGLEQVLKDTGVCSTFLGADKTNCETAVAVGVAEGDWQKYIQYVGGMPTVAWQNLAGRMPDFKNEETTTKDKIQSLANLIGNNSALALALDNTKNVLIDKYIAEEIAKALAEEPKQSPARKFAVMGNQKSCLLNCIDITGDSMPNCQKTCYGKNIISECNPETGKYEIIYFKSDGTMLGSGPSDISCSEYDLTKNQITSRCDGDYVQILVNGQVVGSQPCEGGCSPVINDCVEPVRWYPNLCPVNMTVMFVNGKEACVPSNVVNDACGEGGWLVKNNDGSLSCTSKEESLLGDAFWAPSNAVSVSCQSPLSLEVVLVGAAKKYYCKDVEGATYEKTPDFGEILRSDMLYEFGFECPQGFESFKENGRKFCKRDTSEVYCPEGWEKTTKEGKTVCAKEFEVGNLYSAMGEAVKQREYTDPMAKFGLGVDEVIPARLLDPNASFADKYLSAKTPMERAQVWNYSQNFTSDGVATTDFRSGNTAIDQALSSCEGSGFFVVGGFCQILNGRNWAASQMAADELFTKLYSQKDEKGNYLGLTNDNPVWAQAKLDPFTSRLLMVKTLDYGMTAKVGGKDILTGGDWLTAAAMKTALVGSSIVNFNDATAWTSYVEGNIELNRQGVSATDINRFGLAFAPAVDIVFNVIPVGKLAKPLTPLVRRIPVVRTIDDFASTGAKKITSLFPKFSSSADLTADELRIQAQKNLDKLDDSVSSAMKYKDDLARAEVDLQARIARGEIKASSLADPDRLGADLAKAIKEEDEAVEALNRYKEIFDKAKKADLLAKETEKARINLEDGLEELDAAASRGTPLPEGQRQTIFAEIERIKLAEKETAENAVNLWRQVNSLPKQIPVANQVIPVVPSKPSPVIAAIGGAGEKISQTVRSIADYFRLPDRGLGLRTIDEELAQASARAANLAKKNAEIEKIALSLEDQLARANGLKIKAADELTLAARKAAANPEDAVLALRKRLADTNLKAADLSVQTTEITLNLGKKTAELDAAKKAGNQALIPGLETEVKGLQAQLTKSLKTSQQAEILARQLDGQIAVETQKASVVATINGPNLFTQIKGATDTIGERWAQLRGVQKTAGVVNKAERQLEDSLVKTYRESLRLNPPIIGEFSPEAELARISKLHGSEGLRELEVYKAKLATQKNAWAKTRTFIEETLLVNPDTPKEKLMRWVDQFGSEYGFTAEQKKLAETVLDDYIGNRQGILRLRQDFPDDLDLIKQLTGLDLPPGTKVKVTVSPVSIDIEADPLIVKSLYDRKLATNPSDLTIKAQTTHAFASSAYSNSISGGRYVQYTVNPFKDAEALIHEGQHSINSFFKKTDVSWGRTVERDMNAQKIRDLHPQIDWTGRTPQESLLRDFFTLHKRNFEDDAKDEVLAMLREGRSASKTKSWLLLKGEDALYDYSFVSRKFYYEAYPDSIKAIVKSVMEDSYDQDVIAAIDAFKHLEMMPGYSREQAIILLSNENLADWPNFVRRIGEGLSPAQEAQLTVMFNLKDFYENSGPKDIVDAYINIGREFLDLPSNVTGRLFGGVGRLSAGPPSLSQISGRVKNVGTNFKNSFDNFIAEQTAAGRLGEAARLRLEKGRTFISEETSAQRLLRGEEIPVYHDLMVISPSDSDTALKNIKAGNYQSRLIPEGINAGGKTYQPLYLSVASPENPTYTSLRTTAKNLKIFDNRGQEAVSFQSLIDGTFDGTKYDGVLSKTSSIFVNGNLELVIFDGQKQAINLQKMIVIPPSPNLLQRGLTNLGEGIQNASTNLTNKIDENPTIKAFLLDETGSIKLGSFIPSLGGKKEIVIGRQGDLFKNIGDNSLSRRHAAATIEDGKIVIRDLGSSNGTFVNGKEIHVAVYLNKGDVLKVGNQTLTFEQVAKALNYQPGKQSGNIIQSLGEAVSGASTNLRNRVSDAVYNDPERDFTGPIRDFVVKSPASPQPPAISKVASELQNSGRQIQDSVSNIGNSAASRIDDFKLKKQITIGRRGAGADLIVQSMYVDKEHAIAFIDDNGTIFLKDNNSLNGILINGEKISVATPIKPDDKIFFADMEVPYEQIAASLKAPVIIAPVVRENVILNIGRGAVQQQAIPSHGGVIQDVVSVVNSAVAVTDGVTGAGSASREMAQDIAGKVATELDNLNRTGNSPVEIAQGIKRYTDGLQGSITMEQGATTLTASTIKDGYLINVRVGDAEARIIRNGKASHIDDLTYYDGNPVFDGSFIWPDSEFGSQAQVYKKNTPVQFVGASYGNPEIDSRVTMHKLRQGDRVLLSSDGIAKVLSESEIGNIVSRASNPSEAEWNLVKAAMAKGLRDDYGVSVIFY